MLIAPALDDTRHTWKGIRAMTSKRPSSKKATPAKSWRNKNLHTLEVPSGNIITVRRVGMQAILATGIMPNALMAPITSALAKGKGDDQAEQQLMAQISEEPEKLGELMTFLNKLVCIIAVEPRVEMPVPEGQERDEETLYADEMDDQDKMFLFQFVSGGTRDLETFRNELAAGVASVSGS